MLQIGLVAGCVLLLIGGVCGIALNNAFTGLKQEHCAGNLRQIGIAIQIYWQDHHTYPPDFQATLLTQAILPGHFICPASSDVPASPGVRVGAPGTCSYIYVGASLPAQAKPNAIVALEDPTNHGMEGGRALFADGSVGWLGMPYIVQVLNDLQQGINPPSATTTLTPAQAAKIYDTKWKPLMPLLKSGIWRVPTTAPAK